MAEVRLMNMCMICSKDSRQVVVQERPKSKKWNGICFPGGHVEDAESIMESTIREVREETGLTVRGLRFCGLVHWFNDTTSDRWLLFLFRTSEYSGELLDETKEGRVRWVDLEQLGQMSLARGMEDYLRLFQNESLTEAYAVWNSQSIGGFTLS